MNGRQWVTLLNSPLNKSMVHRPASWAGQPTRCFGCRTLRRYVSKLPMKSGKQRKAEIKKSRLERIAKRDSKVNPFKGPIPEWAIPVNPAEVVHHSMFLDIPLFYIDKEFECKDCGTTEVWTARQQKWWYEIAKGYFETTAVRCRSCRDQRKNEKEAQRKHMEEMANKKPYPNEAFFKNT